MDCMQISKTQKENNKSSQCLCTNDVCHCEDLQLLLDNEPDKHQSVNFRCDTPYKDKPSEYNSSSLPLSTGSVFKYRMRTNQF